MIYDCYHIKLAFLLRGIYGRLEIKRREIKKGSSNRRKFMGNF
jgi:hypothetical protein